MKPKRSKLYSAIKFLRFSEKIEIVFLIVRFIALVFKNIFSTHIYFHVDLVLFCIYLFSFDCKSLGVIFLYDCIYTPLAPAITY